MSIEDFFQDQSMMALASVIAIVVIGGVYVLVIEPIKWVISKLRGGE